MKASHFKFQVGLSGVLGTVSSLLTLYQCRHWKESKFKFIYKLFVLFEMNL